MEIKVGDIIEGEIIDFTHEGNGVMKVNDFIYFVSGGLIGDKVKAKVEKIKKNFALGTVIDIVKPSNDRVNLDIEVEESLGGIPLINYKYEKQLEWKTKKVKTDLEKFAGIADLKVNKILGMDSPYRYRNHVQIPVGSKSGKTITGFYESGTNSIVPMKQTILQSELGNKTLKVIKEWIDRYNINSYDKKRGKGTLRHIGIRTNKEDEVMVILVTGEDNLPKKQELIDMLTSRIKQIKSIYQNINKMRSPVVYGKKYHILWGEEKLIDKIGEYKFFISPNSFFQVNRIQAEKLYNTAIGYLDLNKNDIVYDLYCGTGTISIYMADKVDKVYGIEVVKEAIEDANENKRLNNIENADFIVGKSEEELPRLVKNGLKANKVILDPPRKGCEKQVLEAIVELNPERIVYVSCNSTTMARDIKYLVENGYKAEKVQPVDMFPHAMDAEAVTLLTKKEG